VALAIAFTDFGDARGGAAVASLSDTMVLPASSNAVLYLLMANEHKGTTTVGAVTLTGESVTELRAPDNPSVDSVSPNMAAYAVRNPGSGTKTLTFADDGLVRSWAWAGWLVTGVPTSAFTDDIQADTCVTRGSTTSTATQATSVTTTKPGGLILSLWAARGQSGPWGVSNGWVEDTDDSTGASTTTDFAYCAAHKLATTAGSYSSTGTPTSTNKLGVISISVLPSLSRRRQVILA
jgi:hypothetical protein